MTAITIPTDTVRRAVEGRNPFLQRRGARLLAATVVGQPLLLAVNAAFHPAIDIDAAGVLAGAAEGPGRWFAVHVVAAAGALLGVPAAFGLRRLARGHAVLAGSGLAAAVAGGLVLALSFAAEASVLRIAAGLEPAAGLAVAESYVATPEFYAILPAVLLVTLGGILLAAALLREGAIARWQGRTMIAGLAVTMVAPPGTPVGPLAFAAVAVAATGAARQVARS